MASLKTLIAPAFYPVHQDVKAGLHTHYWLGGGRGSCKSSTVSLEIPLSIMRDGAAGIGGWAGRYFSSRRIHRSFSWV